MDQDELNNRFAHHAPSIDKQGRHSAVRDSCKKLAEALNDLLPEGRDKSLAFTKLEEVMFHSNASIARN